MCIIPLLVFPSFFSQIFNLAHNVHPRALTARKELVAFDFSLPTTFASFSRHLARRLSGHHVGFGFHLIRCNSEFVKLDPGLKALGRSYPFRDS
jgi:hypothetical protein